MILKSSDNSTKKDKKQNKQKDNIPLFDDMDLEVEEQNNENDETNNNNDDLEMENDELNTTSVKTEIIEFKNKILEILEKNEYSLKRAIKMDIDDFLKLLDVFNNEGIHFK